MVRTWQTVAACASLFLLLAAPSRAAVAEPSLTQEIDSFFVQTTQDFDQLVASPIVAKGAAGPVNKFFFKRLAAHQPYQSLLRTNAKGVVTSEVIRLVKQPSTKKQDLSAEPWFKHVSSKLETYTACTKFEETGRYYLVWAAPILAKGAKGKQTFAGVVALKVDLWDCFQKISKTAASPFLIRMGHLYLYSHDWSDTISYAEGTLSVPGVQKISARFPRLASAGGLAADTQASSLAPVAARDSVKALPAKPKCSSTPWLVTIIVLLLIILAFYGIKPLVNMRERMFARKPDHDGF